MHFQCFLLNVDYDYLIFASIECNHGIHSGREESWDLNLQPLAMANKIFIMRLTCRMRDVIFFCGFQPKSRRWISMRNCVLSGFLVSAFFSLALTSVVLLAPSDTSPLPRGLHRYLVFPVEEFVNWYKLKCVSSVWVIFAWVSQR